MWFAPGSEARDIDRRPFTGANAETMKQYINYCAIVNSISGGGCGGTSGIALYSGGPGGTPGDMFIVSLGSWPVHGTVRQHIGTLMHELGHNIGLWYLSRIR